MGERIELTSLQLARMMYHYEGEKRMVFKRKMTSGYQEVILTEIIDDLSTGELIFILSRPTEDQALRQKPEQEDKVNE